MKKISVLIIIVVMIMTMFAGCKMTNTVTPTTTIAPTTSTAPNVTTGPTEPNNDLAPEVTENLLEPNVDNGVVTDKDGILENDKTTDNNEKVVTPTNPS